MAEEDQGRDSYAGGADGAGDAAELGERRARPSLDVPPSVLSVLAARTGEAPRVSLREEDSAAGGAPPIDPGSQERRSLPEGRGAYQILGEIARGGMGVVLRGHDTDLGRDVAMKVLARELAGRPEVVQRFVEEAQIGGQLQHPGIVPVYELGLMADERPYFTMKLVKGRTLATLLAERPTPAAGLRRLVDVFESVCQTVAYAHSRGVIHRDLKPANIMVGAFGEVQVVDWGLAKVLARGGTADEQRARAAQSERTVLETVRSDGSGGGTDSLVGSVLGTPAYMPPEQASGRVDRLDERSDVFALGAILCEILTGAPPYAGEPDEALPKAAHAELDDADGRLNESGADAELVDLARRCLVAAPRARLRNASVLAEGIRAYTEAVDERARSAQIEAAEARVRIAQERKARKLTVALTASLLGTLVLGGGGWAWNQNRERAELERVERGLDDVRARVQALQDEGRTEDAVQAAQNALVLVDGRAQADPLRARAEAIATRAAELAGGARARLEREARNARLVTRLEELRLEASLDLSRSALVELDEAFADAFRAWGLDVDADIVRSLDHLRASPLADELAPALDDWAAVRREVFGWRSFEAEAMNSLAADLDPETLRVRMREALMERDLESLLAIAADPEVDRLPASTAWVLGNALTSLGANEDALLLLERAVARHPGDLRLRIAAAGAATGARELAMALPHISAAAALRPDMPALALVEGMTLARNARFPAAIRSLKRVLAADPESRRAHELLGEAYFNLGQDEEALRAIDRAYALGSRDPKLDTFHASALYRTGAVDFEELDRRLQGTRNSFMRMISCWVLVRGNPGDRDLERAKAIAASIPLPPPETNVRDDMLIIHGMLALLDGRPEDTLDICRQMTELKQLEFVAPTDEVGLSSLRARALVRLGRREEAREWLLEARRLFEMLRADAPEAWERSDVLAQLREAEAELAW